MAEDVPTRMYVTTDAVAISFSPSEGLRVLLVRRANPPFQRSWALPGGFVERDEDLPDACERELREETGVRPSALVQVGAWGKPGRDPRGRNVSVVYIATVRLDQSEPEAGSDAARVEWRRATNLPQLGFDHEEIVEATLERLSAMATRSHIVYGLLPERFDIDALKDALTACSGELMTESEAMAFAKRCRVVKESTHLPREGQLFRCVAADLLAAPR